MEVRALRAGVAALTIFGALAFAGATDMERGAFLRKPAYSRSELITQMDSDPIVAARYEKHFAMSREQLHTYFAGLTTTKLPATGRYLVWHVEPNGAVETKWLNLKKGTEVFVDASGRPILKRACGNPMVSSEVAHRSLPETVASTKPAPPETFVAETPPVTEVVAPPVVTATEVAAVTPPMVETTEVVAPAVPIVTAAAAPAHIGGGGGIGALPLLLLVPLIGGGSGGGGGGGGTPPVPEPGTIVALGLGAVALVASKKKRA